VRRWNPATNSVTTLAGVYGVPGIDDGTGKQARFDQPGGICVLGGAAYVADTHSDTLRKIDLSSGTVSTIAGSPETSDDVDAIGSAARFREPIDVACDGAHTVYVLESGGWVRRVDVRTGSVKTLATAGSYPQALALDATYAYVTSESGSGPLVNRIRLADGSSDTITAPRDAAVLVSLATDGAGNLYTTSRFGTLYRLAADGSTTVLANPKGYWGTDDGPLATATLGSALGLTWDAGTVLVAETGGDKLRRVDLQAGTISTIQGLVGQYWPRAGVGRDARLGDTVAVAVDGDKAYVTCTGVVRIDLGSAAVSVLEPTSGERDLPTASGVVSDGNGHLYFGDRYGASVRRLDLADGTLHTIAGTYEKRGSSDGIGSAATFTFPEGVALDGGTLYVADSWNHNIRAVRLADGSVSTLAGVANTAGASDGVGSDARFNGPTALAADGKGGLYVADRDNGVIRRIDLASASVTTIIGVAGQNGVVTGELPARLNHPSGIAVLPDGSLAISDEQAILVLR
jgi:sugar lactone lactonase YvrE